MSSRRGGTLPSRRHIAELAMNRIITHVPNNNLRVASLRLLGLAAGPHVYLFGGSEFLAPENLSIRGGCHVGRFCQIDARGGISIGNNVVIASHVLMITADHDIQGSDFAGRLGAIIVGDRAWIASRAVITRGVSIGEGAVVAAGAVVVRDVDPWTIVAGVPAKVVGRRNSNQNYTIDSGPIWY